MSNEETELEWNYTLNENLEPDLEKMEKVLETILFTLKNHQLLCDHKIIQTARKKLELIKKGGKQVRYSWESVNNAVSKVSRRLHKKQEEIPIYSHLSVLRTACQYGWALDFLNEYKEQVKKILKGLKTIKSRSKNLTIAVDHFECAIYNIEDNVAPSARFSWGNREIGSASYYFEKFYKRTSKKNQYKEIADKVKTLAGDFQKASKTLNRLYLA